MHHGIHPDLDPLGVVRLGVRVRTAEWRRVGEFGRYPDLEERSRAEEFDQVRECVPEVDATNAKLIRNETLFHADVDIGALLRSQGAGRRSERGVCDQGAQENSAPGRRRSP